MFRYERTLFLRETDATGVLYFSEQFKLGLEALEAYFLSRGFTLQQMIEQEDFLLPIVHAEADYKNPLFVGDKLTIMLSLDHVGTSSFTLRTELYKKGILSGTANITHVALSKETKGSIPLPESIHAHLRELRALQGKG